MKPHLKACAVREDKGKKYWTRLGVAFPKDNGIITILLDAIPASQEGQYKIVLLPPEASAAPADAAEVVPDWAE